MFKDSSDRIRWSCLDFLEQNYSRSCRAIKGRGRSRSRCGRVFRRMAGDDHLITRSEEAAEELLTNRLGSRSKNNVILIPYSWVATPKERLSLKQLSLTVHLTQTVNYYSRSEKFQSFEPPNSLTIFRFG